MIKNQKFIIPKAQPNTETSLCQYFAACQKKLSPCTENPDTRSLKIVGIIDDKMTFTPIKPEKQQCPKTKIRGI